MRLTLVHNPESGSDQPSGDALVALARDAGYDVTYQSTKDATLGRALESPGDLVLVAGGDGTVAKVAKQLVGRNVPLAVAPLGTSNNIARSLGLHGSAREIIQGLSTAVTVSLDVGRASAPWGTARFVEAVGIGFFGRVLRHAEERRERADADPGTTPVPTALRGIHRALDGYRACHRDVLADGEDLSGPYVMVAVMNICSIGPRMTLAPSADLGDGRLDLLLLHESERAALADHLSDLADGRDVRFSVPTRRVRHVSVGWDIHEGHLDDEVWPDRGAPERERWAEGPVTVEAEIVDAPLRVLVPGGARVQAPAESATTTPV